MILAFDATTKTASTALYHDYRLIAEFTVNNGYTHSETLLPLIDQTLNVAKVKPSDLEALIVANGPGSFTGIRIALSTAKGLAHACNIPLYTASTLRALSYHGVHFKGLVCPILDARRSQVYSAVFDENGDYVISSDTYQIDRLIDLLGRADLLKESVLFIGDATQLHVEKLMDKLSGRAVIGGLNQINNTATGLIHAHLTQRTDKYSYIDVAVEYLRKPQAEREREASQ